MTMPVSGRIQIRVLVGAISRVHLRVLSTARDLALVSLLFREALRSRRHLRLQGLFFQEVDF